MSQGACRPATLSPGLVPSDPLAAYWMRQATLRLRREICWIWHERGVTPIADSGVLPPPADRAIVSLELSRYVELKRQFFESDETSRYLSELLREPEPSCANPPRGSFSWVKTELELSAPATFVQALALSAVYDNAMGSVIAACLNDVASERPTLALAQKLWDEPVEILELADRAHALFRFGLLRSDAPEIPGSMSWRAPLVVPAHVARHLIDPDSPLPQCLHPLRDGPVLSGPARDTATVTSFLDVEDGERHIVPIVGPSGCDHVTSAAVLALQDGRTAVRYDGGLDLLSQSEIFDAIASYCWLRDLHLYIGQGNFSLATTAHNPSVHAMAESRVPVKLYVAVEELSELKAVPKRRRLPAVQAPQLSFWDRVALWNSELGAAAPKLEDAIVDCSRRFRYEEQTIRSICRNLTGCKQLGRDELVTACRAELNLELGELADETVPRFSWKDLILPHQQALQLDEIRRAMRSVAEVHYQWGTARAWNEAGVSALFAGPPGTGKTMASEVLARELEMPLFRVDLSQVVNKYIGETEKNLKRLFDECDRCDLILFFDEADAIFGRRTDVKDAHDRYANIEVSYLLGRMERAKGLTILATNRKDDLDAAFLRRLRYTVDFPLPGAFERQQIWERSMPDGVDATSIDVEFLAGQFQLTGGHIQSAIFNACLQSASHPCPSKKRKTKPKLRMDDVLVAVRRELDKANRTVSLDQFGRYAPAIEKLERPAEFSS